jgi:site-specific DNA-methyltransferase (adenine-specific)
MNNMVSLLLGDCLAHLKDMESNSVDSIVTDPPYGISFLNKKWDYDIPSIEIWKECLRVLKPGGHLLSFGGSRTFHRIAVSIENAGFDIRDAIMWIYGTGFPKSLNIGKKIPDYRGWGTTLKPSYEPIVMCRKPFKGTVAENVLEYGTGGINIDGCRIPLNGDEDMSKLQASSKSIFSAGANDWTTSTYKEEGRFPANILHDGSDEVLESFPDGKLTGKSFSKDDYDEKETSTPFKREDKSSAARFFYCTKASKKDRNEGCEELEEKQYSSNGRDAPLENAYGRDNSVSSNTHPTVKPTELMKYLCRLVTPLNGIVLDPFMGSGSTGKAALLEGFSFIGIEMDEEYFEIAKRRVNDGK